MLKKINLGREKKLEDKMQTIILWANILSLSLILWWLSRWLGRKLSKKEVVVNLKGGGEE